MSLEEIMTNVENLKIANIELGNVSDGDVACTLTEKVKMLDNAAKVLKSEFFGIDEQIDDLITSFKPWFLFPNLNDRPVVICLWGMTGIGKTSLVRRLIELIDRTHCAAFFDISKMVQDEWAYRIEYKTVTRLQNNNLSESIFVLDEFQFARIIDERGLEKDVPSVNLCWELIDTGKVKMPFIEIYNKELASMLKVFKVLKRSGSFQIKDGVVVGDGERLYYEVTGRKVPYSNIFTERESESEKTAKKTILSRFEKGILFECLSTEEPEKFIKESDLYRMFESIDLDGLLDLIEKAYRISLKETFIDCSHSLVFVLGNLDEAYDVSSSMNPDMSPDQFRKLTKKINIVTIKECLKRRFRNEQISRLGNTHLIYPALSSSAYKQVIKYNIEKYFNEVKAKHGIEITADKSVYKVIYDESVFPTQGVRPVLSSIVELVKTKLANVITYANENGIVFDSIRYSFKRSFFNADFIKGGKVIGKYKVKQKLRLTEARNKVDYDQTAISSVHEAGHAVAMITLVNIIPDKVCSVTVDTEKGGFTTRMYNKDYCDMQDYLNEVAVYLAGRAAEEIVFGSDKVTNGATEDLTTVTELVIKLFGCTGLNGNLYKNSIRKALTFDHLDRNIYSDNTEEMKKFVNDAYKKAKETIVKNDKFFRALIRELLENHSISKQKLRNLIVFYYDGDYLAKILAEKATDSGYYREQVNKFLGRN